MSDDHLESLKIKRLKILEEIKPICEAFNITDYDYIVKKDLQTETLRINNTYIACSLNSVSAVKDELIGWIIINIYSKNRGLGAFQKQTENYIKRYWLDSAAKAKNGFE